MNILQSIGLGDGSGNTSSMRVILYIVVLSILAPAVYIAFVTKTPLALTTDQIGLISAALAAKCVQNHQENMSSPTPKTPVT